MTSKILSTFLSTLMIIGLVAGTGTGQRSTRGTIIETTSAIPIAEPMGGNPTCTTLNNSTDPLFAHIGVDFGLKVERTGDIPFTETFYFVDSDDTELQGGAGASPGNSLTLSVSGTTVSWSSTRPITAVIVKGGTEGANVYPYNPASLGGFPNGDGTGLVTGSQNDISHLVFCFGSLAPSAASASVSGRVIDSNGYGIASARLVLSDVQNGSTWYALTNPFGYYTIDGPEVGNFYSISVTHKRFSFVEETHAFTLNDNITGMDFIANP